MAINDNPKARNTKKREPFSSREDDTPIAPENPLPKNEIDKAGKSLLKRSVKKQDFWTPGERIIKE